MSAAHTGTTSFEHPVTGADITVTVQFEAHPPEPEIGLFCSFFEVTDYSHDGDPMTSDEGAAEDHVDDLPDAWFAEVIRDAAEDAADHRYQMQKEDDL